MGTKCPKCGIPYNDPKVSTCLLCGSELIDSQPVEAEVVPKRSKPKKQKPTDDNQEVIHTTPKGTPIVCEVTEVPPFNDKGGFSKRNGKQDVVIGQLQADNEDLRKRYELLESCYKKEHPEAKSWYTLPGNWFALLLVLGMIYLIYRLATIPDILPPEAYEFLRRIRF